MKKKILFSIFTLFVVSLFVVNANAAIFSVGANTKAKSPENVPASGDVLYAITTQEFDFSKLEFAPKSGSTNINGKTDLKKIILGKLKETLSDEPPTLDSTFDEWFSAYCLDNTKKYPLYGILSSDAYQSATTSEEKLNLIVIAALGTDSRIQDAIKSKITGVTYAIDSLYADGDYSLSDGDTLDSVVSAIEGLSTEVTIKLSKINITVPASGSFETKSVTAANITGDSGATTYDLKFKGKDVLLDKYIASDNRNVSGYDHALWIIEHSYPTLALKASVEESGAEFEELKREVCVLEGGTYNETALTCTGVDGLDDYVENYVFGVVQYAIWKSTGYEVNGVELGDSVVNSTELNKLYQFLTQNRDEYNGYSTKTFTNKVTVKIPKEGKELYKETDKAYMYGPYTASYDVLGGGNLKLTVTNKDKTGIKLVNESGNEITSVIKGEKFYIQCTKSENISGVTVNVTLEDAAMFSPLTNRGRIYNSGFVLEQNVMSGGKIINKNIETSFNLVVNPKTGVENVALLLMVTLVAFTLAYLVLSYKQKPVKLD